MRLHFSHGHRPAALALAMCVVSCLMIGCDRPAPSAAQQQTSNSPPKQAVASPAPPAVSPAPTGQSPPNASTPPRISFDRYTIDFGKISEVNPVSASFPFTNIGGQTLVIDQVKTTCSCTAAGLTRREYPPGESGTIDITFTPAGPSNDPKLINVISNSNPDAFVRLTIRADVQAFLDVQPRILETGILAYRQEHRLTVTVACPPDDNFEILSINTTNPYVTGRAMPASPGTRARTVEVIIAPATPWGMLFSWLEVTGRGKPAPGAAPITFTAKTRVQGQIFGELRAVPDAFRFGVKPGEAFARTIRVYRADGQPFDVISAAVTSSDIPGATVSARKSGPGDYQITLAAVGDRLRPLASGSIAVTTNVPGEEKIDIPIYGVVRTDDPSVH